MSIRFGIFADLHTELIHDSVSRLRTILSAFRQADCDFCIELGDFCPPGERNAAHKEQILALTDAFPIPLYHTIGNHDMDANEKADVVRHLGMEHAYYSFDRGGVHFVVLDACYYREGDTEISYERGNYKSCSDGAALPILPAEELAWLKKDLAETSLPTVLFSHQALSEGPRGIRNADALQAVLQSAPCRVILAACGHEHVDFVEQKNGVYYWYVNSASYYWAGSRYKHTTYGEAWEEQYHTLRYVFPYRDALYAIVEIDDGEIRITGTHSEIVGATPEELHYPQDNAHCCIVPRISDRTLSL